jgi:hypothetical protein
LINRSAIGVADSVRCAGVGRNGFDRSHRTVFERGHTRGISVHADVVSAGEIGDRNICRANRIVPNDAPLPVWLQHAQVGNLQLENDLVTGVDVIGQPQFEHIEVGIRRRALLIARRINYLS